MKTSKSSTKDGWGYNSEYSIQSSWVGRSDTLKESMVAYTKKMSEIRRIRGINVFKQSVHPELAPSFQVNNSKLSHTHPAMSDDHSRKLYFTNRMTRSLGSIRLEPLLGSQKTSPRDTLHYQTALQTYRMRNKQPMSGSVPDLTQDENNMKVPHATLSIVFNIPFGIDMIKISCYSMKHTIDVVNQIQVPYKYPTLDWAIKT